MSYLMTHVAIVVFLMSGMVSMAKAADQQYRERVLVGEFPGSPGKADRELVKAMVGQKLDFIRSERGVALNRWKLQADLEDDLPATEAALKQKWSMNPNVLVLMHGSVFSGSIVSTIFVGEKVPGFQVETGFAIIPRMETFLEARDAMTLLVYYALLKDASQKGLTKDESIRPILDEAQEILEDLKKTVNRKWVKDIADDFEKLRSPR